MKKTVLLFALIACSLSTFGQSIQITDMSVAAVAGGINVNVQTISFNGADYLSYDYTITGTIVDLSVCYSFNMLAPVPTFNNDFFIPIEEAGEYTVNVTVYNSSSNVTCDYYSSGGSATTNVLSTTDIAIGSQFRLFPNPTNNYIEFDGNLTIENISIYDHLGKLILQSKIITDNRIDLSNFSQGLYFVKISSESHVFVQKVVKR